MRAICCAFMLLFISGTVCASDLSFSPIVSYTWDGAWKNGDVYIENDLIRIGKRSGIISNIPVKKNTIINFTLKPSAGSGKYSIGKKKGHKWVEDLIFGVTDRKLNSNETISDNNTQHVLFRISSCTDFKKEKPNVSIISTMKKKAVYTHDVCLIAKKLNQISLTIQPDSIELYINGSKAAEYNGNLSEELFLVIGTNTALPFHIGKRIEFKGFSKTYNIKIN